MIKRALNWDNIKKAALVTIAVILLPLMLFAYCVPSGCGCSCDQNSEGGEEDTTAPVITDVTVLEISMKRATITWNTDEVATTLIEYGTTDSYGSYSTLVQILYTSHTDTLTRLTANTSYHYRVRSTDASGNEAISDDYTFTTLPLDPTKQVNFPDINLEIAIRGATGILQDEIYIDDLALVTSLDASESDITDLTGLEHCTSITYLDLDYNQISDISSLSDLTGLSILKLRNNNISDISALLGLTGLNKLWLNFNDIVDIEPLVNNTGLGTGDLIYLAKNPLNSISKNAYITVLEDRGVYVSF